MPKSLLVMGSGAIGIEFASFYKTMGADVTVVEVMPQILPVEDEEIAALARKRFEKQGMKILSGAKVTGVTKQADSLTVHVEDSKGAKQDFQVERMISAVGVVGNVDGLGLENLGCEDRARHHRHGRLRPHQRAGRLCHRDVAGAPMLAHKAEHEGVICVETIKGLHTHPMDKAKIPGCTYCTPQIASVGLTEKKARELGVTSASAAFPSSATARPLRWASRRVWSRPSSTRRPANCWAPSHRCVSDRAHPWLRHRHEP